VSDTLDKIISYERLGDKLSLMIYLQNFLKAGEDVDGNGFLNDRGGRIADESVAEVIADLEETEKKYLDEMETL